MPVMRFLRQTDNARFEALHQQVRDQDDREQRQISERPTRMLFNT